MSAPDHEAELARLRAENQRLAAELERVRARSAAQEQAGNMGLWELELATGKGHWSPKMYELYYMEPQDEPPGVEMGASRIHPDDYPLVLANMGALMQTGSAPPIVFRTHPDIGPTRYICAAINRTGQGPDGTIFGAAADVTEQMRVEGELALSWRTLEAIYQHSPYTILAIERDGSISFINHAVEGLTVEQVVGMHYGDFIGDGDRARVVCAVERVFAQGSHEHCEHEDRGGGLWDSHWVPIGDGSGETVDSVLCFTHEVTEQRQLQRQIQQAQKLESLGVLAGGIAHDFNNLLVAIMGNAELAQMDLPSHSPVRQSVDEIMTGAHRAAELCRQMLAYSGKGRFVVQSVNVPELVAEMAHLLEVSISKRVVLRYDFAADTEPVEADVTQLRQIVMNLITNASDAIGHDEGVISVTSGTAQFDRAHLERAYLRDDLPEGRYTFIEVADTGCGMDEQTREHMFEPFYSSKAQGRGLGLSAALGIVRSHRGAVIVDSEPGKGTTIKILLPATDKAPAAAAMAKSAAGRANGQGLILVVDDEAHVRGLASRSLRRAGYTVVTANDGIEALQVFNARHKEIAGVLLDMTMPRMDGQSTFVELRKLAPEVRVLLSSGYDEKQSVSQFAGKDYASFIQKPYRPTTLVQALRDLLDAN